MKKMLVLVACGLFLCSSVFGVTLEEGVAAHQHGDYPAAAKILRELSDQGDARAQLILGGMYSDGKGVTQDHAEAYFWLSLALSHDALPELHDYIVKCRDLALSRITPVQRDEVHARCAKWLEEFEKRQPADHQHQHQHE